MNEERRTASVGPAMCGVLVASLLVLCAGGASAATLAGHVYVDLDSSGSYSGAEEALAGVAVTIYARIDDWKRGRR